MKGALFEVIAFSLIKTYGKFFSFCSVTLKSVELVEYCTKRSSSSDNKVYSNVNARFHN